MLLGGGLDIRGWQVLAALFTTRAVLLVLLDQVVGQRDNAPFLPVFALDLECIQHLSHGPLYLFELRVFTVASRTVVTLASEIVRDAKATERLLAGFTDCWFPEQVMAKRALEGLESGFYFGVVGDSVRGVEQSGTVGGTPVKDVGFTVVGEKREIRLETIV